MEAVANEDFTTGQGRMMGQIRQAIRRLHRSPAFTMTTVLTLAIAIGATTAMFSVTNSVLIKPLPFPESDRLIELRHQAPGAGNFDTAASPAIYFTYREHNGTFESVALWFSNTATVTDNGDPEEVQRLVGTFEFLPTLGVEPILGRTFAEAEDQPGGPGAVILSYSYWQSRFGGAEDVIGRSIRVDGELQTIVGVMPQSFRFLQEPAEILMPARPNREFAFFPSTGERGIARLRDGVTLADASADVERMVPIIMETFPILPGLTRESVEDLQFGPNLRPLKDQLVGDLDDVLWILMGTIGLLLVVACANVANLQLVRTEARGQELAIRTALGANWATIARSLLFESILLGLFSGAVGFVMAVMVLPVLLSIAGQYLPAVLAIGIDTTVLVFALAISIISGLVFGSIPAFRYAGPGISAVLSATGRTMSQSRERHRTRNALLIAQVALALILLVASGLMIRTFISLRDVDPGFTEPGTLQTLRISLPQAAVPDYARVTRIQNDLQSRMAAIAGVESVGFSNRLPLTASGPNGPFSLEDDPDGSPRSLEFRYVSPRFFETIGTPLIAGRDLQWSDNYSGAQLAVVSETFARREWGSPSNALGRRMRRSESAPWLEIVGVVGDVRHDGLDQRAPDSAYLSLSEFVAQFAARNVTYFVRSERTGTAGFIEDLERAIWSVDGNLPLASPQTMGELYARSMGRTSLTLLLLAITSGMALLLGLVGVYGVVSYLLSNRMREIGIRMALGARDAALTKMLMRHVLLLVAVGIALGLGAAAGLSQLIESQLFGVTPLDPATYLGVSVLLIATAALAGYLPSRRVTRIDPAHALRAE